MDIIIGDLNPREIAPEDKRSMLNLIKEVVMNVLHNNQIHPAGIFYCIDLVTLNDPNRTVSGQIKVRANRNERGYPLVALPFKTFIKEEDADRVVNNIIHPLVEDLCTNEANNRTLIDGWLINGIFQNKSDQLHIYENHNFYFIYTGTEIDLIKFLEE